MVIDSKNPVGFRSSDRWVQHPDTGKTKFWKAAGRNDDVVRLYTSSAFRVFSEINFIRRY